MSGSALFFMVTFSLRELFVRVIHSHIRRRPRPRSRSNLSCNCNGRIVTTDRRGGYLRMYARDTWTFFSSL